MRARKEEALLLAKFLRDKRKMWTPRSALLCAYDPLAKATL